MFLKGAYLINMLINCYLYLQVYSRVDWPRWVGCRHARRVFAKFYSPFLSQHCSASGSCYAQRRFVATGPNCNRDSTASSRLQQFCQGILWARRWPGQGSPIHFRSIHPTTCFVWSRRLWKNFTAGQVCRLNYHLAHRNAARYWAISVLAVLVIVMYCC